MATTVLPETKAGDLVRLEIRRVIRASRQRIFEALTRPEEILHWFGPDSVRVLAAEAEISEGGTYSITTTACEPTDGPDAGKESRVHGVYRKVVFGELLVFTWRPDWRPEEESLVTIRLRDVEGGTELLLKHEQFMTEESCKRHEQGWLGTMGKLTSFLG